MFKWIRSRDREPRTDPKCCRPRGRHGSGGRLQDKALRTVALLGLVVVIVVLTVGLVEYLSDRQDTGGSDRSTVQVNVTVQG